MKVLLPTDGSDYSLGAAKFLSRLNFSSDDEIRILYAISWIPVVTEWEFFYNDFAAIRDDVAPRILELTENELGEIKARKESSSIEEYPDTAIIDTASDSDIDLIVMGSRGLRGISSNIVGSVAKAVAVKSPKPALIVKSAQWEATGKLRILFASDGSDHSLAVGKALREIPFPGDSELTILNVEFPVISDIPEYVAAEINDKIKGIVAKARERDFKESEGILKKSREVIGDKFSSVDLLTRFGDPAEEILSAAETMDADIIAIGRSGTRGIIKRLGSVSRYVLNHSKCSLLIAKL